MISITLGHLGPDSGVRSYMYDIIVVNPTFEINHASFEHPFAALKATGLTLKPSKVQFGQKEILV